MTYLTHALFPPKNGWQQTPNLGGFGQRRLRTVLETVPPLRESGFNGTPERFSTAGFFFQPEEFTDEKFPENFGGWWDHD